MALFILERKLEQTWTLVQKIELMQLNQRPRDLDALLGHLLDKRITVSTGKV